MIFDSYVSLLQATELTKIQCQILSLWQMTWGHLCHNNTIISSQVPLGADTRRIFFIIEHQNSIIVVTFDQQKKGSKFKFGARKKLQIHFFLSQNCHKFLKIWSYISVTKLRFFGGIVNLCVHPMKVLNTFSSQNYVFALGQILIFLPFSLMKM